VRRRIKKNKSLGKPAVFLKPKRKIGGVAPKRWCPEFAHRGPWLAEGALLIAPDNATPECIELVGATARQERCDWCDHVRDLTELELRRRLRPKDFAAARLVRASEENRSRSRETFGRRFSLLQPGCRKLFLLETTDSGRRHMVGRERTLCGGPVLKVTWQDWAGVDGSGRPSSRCPACHREALRLSDDQLDVLFAHMLAISRPFKAKHPCDHVRAHDLETGRVLMSDEWCDCEHCEGKGRTRPDPAEYVWDACDPCSSRGWRVV